MFDNTNATSMFNRLVIIIRRLTLVTMKEGLTSLEITIKDNEEMVTQIMVKKHN